MQMTTARFDPLRLALLAAGCIGLGTILAALVFEHGFGYAPCPLCLKQRWPYYIGVPIALLASALPRPLLAVQMPAAVGLMGLFGWGLYLGVYQAGAEWRLWQGPRDCSGGGDLPSGVGDLMSAINASTVVSCTDPQFRFIGLSFAGWNAVIMASLILVLAAGLIGYLRSR